MPSITQKAHEHILQEIEAKKKEYNITVIPADAIFSLCQVAYEDRYWRPGLECTFCSGFILNKELSRDTPYELGHTDMCAIPPAEAFLANIGLTFDWYIIACEYEEKQQ